MTVRENRAGRAIRTKPARKKYPDHAQQIAALVSNCEEVNFSDYLRRIAHHFP